MESSCSSRCSMFLFSFFGEAKMDTRGTPCLAKNDTALKPAINSRSSDTVSLNEKHFNWKFIAEYGKSYFIILSHNTTQKIAFYHSFVFIPFLRNTCKLISRNASSQMPRRIANTTHQHHYSSYVLIYAFYAFLILSLPSIGERARIKILRYDFSDRQASKNVCYLRIATLKSQSCKRGK